MQQLLSRNLLACPIICSVLWDNNCLNNVENKYLITEKLTQPCIVICRHTSHLLKLVMLAGVAINLFPINYKAH